MNPTSISLLGAQPFLFKGGTHTQLLLGSVYKVQDISPSVGNIYMKHQTNPHVVETEVTNPLKDRGQALSKVVTQAHVLDGKQKGDLVVMKPPTRKNYIWKLQKKMMVVILTTWKLLRQTT